MVMNDLTLEELLAVRLLVKRFTKDVDTREIIANTTHTGRTEYSFRYRSIEISTRHMLVLMDAAAKMDAKLERKTLTPPHEKGTKQAHEQRPE
jgi:hypothetical protein